MKRRNLTVEDVVVMYAYAEAIVETVREPLVILDEDLRVKTANKSFFDTFKVAKDDTYNRLLFEIGNGQWNIPELKTLLKDILSKNSYFDGYEVCQTFDGIGKRSMVLNARRIVLEGHKTELILLAIEDITLRREHEKRKDDFLSIASHELRTPLTSIKAYTQLLAKRIGETEDSKNIHFIKSIEDQTNKLVVLINDLLDLSKIETGKLRFNMKKFDLEALIRKVVTDFQYMSENHQIKCTGHLDRTIVGDEDRIGQVLTNLLTNAIKFSPEAQDVLISMKQNQAEAIVCVHDYGKGIPKSKQKAIFDKFYQVTESGDVGKKGFGLGLFISSEIIKRHHGRIWVESTNGKGATFCFALPLKNGRIAESLL
jgi:signal transduction histidine kinase